MNKDRDSGTDRDHLVELGKKMRPEMGFKLGYSSRGGDIVIDDRQAIP